MMLLHQQHVIHRDLKPENILLDNDYHPYITDFGLSKFYEVGKSMIQSQYCGTSIYMAPEIILGSQYNGKVDVYSFGILMYEVVTNLSPYPNLLNGKLSQYSFNKKIVDEDYRPIFEYPINQSIQKLIESCWSKDPKERPTFEEIYKKLAYNIDDLVDNIYDDINDEDNNNNYYLEDVDVNEVIAYANDIEIQVQSNKEESKSINDLVDKISLIIKENEEMKSQILNIQKEKDEIIKKFDNSLLNANKNIQDIKKENEEMKSQILNIQKEKDEMKSQILNIQKEKDEMKSQILNIQKENEEMKSQILNIQKEKDEIIKKFQRDTRKRF